MGRLSLGRCLAIFLSLILASAVVVLDPPPAAAAAQCSASGCDGKWPGEQGCRDDQQVVASYLLYLDSVTPGTPANLYYSRACQAAWAEFIINGTPPYLGLQLWAQPTYGGSEWKPLNADGFQSTLVAGTTDVHRTVLASWDYSLKACHSTSYQSGSDPEGTDDGDCTRWV